MVDLILWFKVYSLIKGYWLLSVPTHPNRQFQLVPPKRILHSLNDVTVTCGLNCSFEI